MTDTERMTLAELRELEVDVSTVTLGHMVEIEMQSGKEFGRLLLSPVGRKLVALFLREWRKLGTAPSWHELSSRQVLGGGSSISAGSSAGHHPKSSD